MTTVWLLKTIDSGLSLLNFRNLMIRTSLSKLMKWWVFLLALLYLAAPTSINLGTRIIGIMFITLLFGRLLSTKEHIIEYAPNLQNLKISRIIILLAFQFFCMNYAASFYTGASIDSVIYNLVSGNNSYALYQNHFRENEISNFTITKVPAIFALAAVKFIFLYLSTALLFKKSEIFEKFLYATSIIPIVLMASARGTFFEIFEIFVILTYGSALKIRKIRIKNIIYLAIISVVLISGFLINTMRRYEDPSNYFESICATSMYCFEPIGINFYIEYFLYVLSAYFSMGIFFLSSYIELLLNGQYIGSLMPFFSTDFFGFYQGGLEKSLCTNELDCRAVWMPELISWISVFGGLLVFLMLGTLLSSLSRIEKYIYKKESPFSFPVASLFFIYLVSLPVGKFWTVSSQNIVCTLVFVGLLIVSKRTRPSN